MTANVDRLANLLQDFEAAIDKEIAAAEADVSAAKSETVEAVTLTRDRVRAVRDQAAKLRAVLGAATNNPPTEDKKGWLG